jgi:hypothetical protein
LLVARHDDEAAAKAWEDRMTSLTAGCRPIVEWLHRDGHLSRQLNVDTATDLMWAIASVQLWDALIVAVNRHPCDPGATCNILHRPYARSGLLGPQKGTPRGSFVWLICDQQERGATAVPEHPRAGYEP